MRRVVAAAAAAVWPTIFGPGTGDGTAPVPGPPLQPTAGWQAFDLGDGQPWAAVWRPWDGLRADAAGRTLLLAQLIAAPSANFSVLAIDPATGGLAWATPLDAPSSGYPCSPLAFALDAAGAAAYASVACGPEPLSMMNWLFRLDARTGAVAFRTSTDGTGSLTALLPTADGAHVVTTVGARDAPGALTLLDAATGAPVASGGANFSLFTSNAALALSADGGTLSVADAPEWPYAAAFDLAPSGGGGAPGLQQLWASGGPPGAGSGSYALPPAAPFVPPVVLPGGDVVQAFSPRWGDPPGAFTVWRVRPGDGSVVWATSIPIGAANASVTGLAAAPRAGLLWLSVQYDQDRFTTMFYLNATDGSRPAPGCAFTSPWGDSSLQRGLAVDEDAPGGPVGYAVLLGGRPAAGLGTLPRINATFAAVVGSTATCGGGPACCGVVQVGWVTNASTPQNPFLLPLTGAMFTPPAWPSLALGPAPGQLTALVPGRGVFLFNGTPAAHGSGGGAVAGRAGRAFDGPGGVRLTVTDRVDPASGAVVVTLDAPRGRGAD